MTRTTFERNEFSETEAYYTADVICLKTPDSSKINIFIEERFNNLIYSTDTIIKCGIWQPVKFQLVSRFWIGSKMKLFLSYLWINVGTINSEIR